MLRLFLLRHGQTEYNTERRIQDAKRTIEQLEKPFLAEKEAWEKEKARLREKASGQPSK